MLSSPRLFPPILAVALVLCIGVAHGIRCYKCGQYNEGVGSITPCINYTAHMLIDCPASDEWCIVKIRQRRFDGARLRAAMHREGGLEHEDVLLSTGWLQLRTVVGGVERRVLRPGDHAGDPRGVPKPSWLIRHPAIRRSRRGPSIRQAAAMGGRTLHLVFHVCAETIEASCEPMSRGCRRYSSLVPRESSRIVCGLLVCFLVSSNVLTFQSSIQSLKLDQTRASAFEEDCVFHSSSHHHWPRISCRC